MKVFWWVLAIGGLGMAAAYALVPDAPVSLDRASVEGTYVYEARELPPGMRETVAASLRASYLAIAGVSDESELVDARWPLAQDSLRALQALPEVERTGRLDVDIRLELRGDTYTMERRIALPEADFGRSDTESGTWSTTPTGIVLGDGLNSSRHEIEDGAVHVHWLGVEFVLPSTADPGD